MPNYSIQDKNCATCTYWKGNRTYKRVGNHIYIPKSEKAPCRFSKKKFFTIEKHTPQHCCENWSTWNAIK